jgi:steroid delta-isomerase-like uncharacterized protein
MDAEAMKETTRRWIIGIWADSDFSLMDKLATNDYVYRAEGEDELGGSGLRDYVTSLKSAFPDLTNTIDTQVAEGAIVVTRGTTRGTQTGPFGEIPATGKKVVVPWVMFTRFDGERIAEDWEIFNALSLMQQLGVIPS